MFSQNPVILLSQLSAFIPVVMGFVCFKRLNPSFKLFFFFTVFGLFTEFFIVWYVRNVSSNNLPLLYVFSLAEYFSFTVVFCYYLFSAQWKRLHLIFLCIGLILTLLEVFVWSSKDNMNSIFRTFESVLLVGFSLMFFWKSLAVEKNDIPIFKQPMFWYSAGVLIYFSVNLLFFLLFNKLVVQNSHWLETGKLLHAGVNTLANLVFAQSFLCFRRTV